MPVYALIADDDLDTHQFLRDVLEIHYKNIKIEKALTYNSFMDKARRSDPPFDLIILDYHLDRDHGNDIIASIHKEFPEILEKVVLLNGTPEELASDERVNGVQSIQKPFSLDTFGEIVKKICAG
ncbi:MAG: response regulator [Chitinivibrionales bacterium]|nr:response regulator [Chitinivibrionales bacterium]